LAIFQPTHIVTDEEAKLNMDWNPSGIDRIRSNLSQAIAAHKMFPDLTGVAKVALFVVNGVEFVEVVDCTNINGGVTVDCRNVNLCSLGATLGPSKFPGMY